MSQDKQSDDSCTAHADGNRQNGLGCCLASVPFISDGFSAPDSICSACTKVRQAESQANADN